MRNPVEIVRKVWDEEFCGTLNGGPFATAIIAALEKEGYKVIGREPTVEMVAKAGDHLTDDEYWETGFFETVRKMIVTAHDAAPRYSETSK